MHITQFWIIWFCWNRWHVLASALPEKQWFTALLLHWPSLYPPIYPWKLLVTEERVFKSSPVSWFSGPTHTLWKKTLAFHGKVWGMHKQLNCSISRVSILRSTHYTGQRWEQRVFPDIWAKETASPEWENGNSSTWSTSVSKNQGKPVSRNEGEWGRPAASAVNERRAQNHSFIFSAKQEYK